MAFAEDLSVFFDQDDFAVEAEFSLPGNAVRTIPVIFNTPTQETAIYDTAIEADAPFLSCKTADIVGVKTKRSTVLINAKTYTVEKITDDGTGVSQVYLKG